MKRIALATVLVPLVLSNCTILSGRCLYELRGVTASGSFVTPADSVSAEIFLAEQRDYEPDKNMSWQINGPTLKGHITRITLEDNSASPRTYYDFPLAPSSIPMLSNGFVRQSEGANLNGLFDLLGSKRGLVVIRTDQSNRPIITVPLTSVREDDWSRPYCS